MAARFARAIIVVVILGALVLFARTVQWREAWDAMRAASPGVLLAAAVVNLASLVLKGVRWWVFLRPIGVPSLWLAVRGTFAGAAVNNVLIANTGEAARTVLVARAAQVPSERVLATVALERLFESIGYVLLLTLAASFLELPPSIAAARPVGFVALVLVTVLLVYLVRAPHKEAASLSEASSAWERVKQYLRGFGRTMAAISTWPRFAAALAITAGVWGLQVVTYQLTAEAAGLEISTVGTVAALLAVNIGFAARATPGNVGVFQMIYAVTASAFGVDKDAAIGVALLIQFQQMVPVTVLGLLAAPEILQRGKRPLQ